MTRIIPRILAMGLATLFLGWPDLSLAQADITREQALKAAFLYNFTKFVEWPPERFPDPQSPIVIALFKEGPVKAELERITQGRKVGGRPIAVKLVQSAAQAASAHVLFIGNDEEGLLSKDQIENLHRGGVLTVGASQDFAALGWLITFVLEGDKMRFQINLYAAEHANLKISAQLLKLATTDTNKR